ncbi:MAG: hypothetical protein JSV80_13915 [Acidobacteriota bacterium]|nr:MAG: hypothetical protein JSV80_13915 [Acidobacteriota bacterium]
MDYQVPAEGTKPQLLAVALNGRFESYFAGKQPPAAEGTGDADGPGEPPAEVPLEVSPETRLVVIGNAEFLSDFVARALGRTEGGFFDANLGFAQNLIDWMNLDSDLLAIRARGGAARQLDRLERSTEVTVELSNYLAPLLALFGFGAYRLWRRRHVAPVVGRRAASMPAVPKTSGHGAGREG